MSDYIDLTVFALVFVCSHVRCGRWERLTAVSLHISVHVYVRTVEPS